MINKGEAVRFMQRRLGLYVQHTLAAGDDPIDIAMFDLNVAAYVVCPANAHPEVKEAVARRGGIAAGKNFSCGVIEGAENFLKGIPT